MPIEVKKPGSSTRRGQSSPTTPPPKDIYDVADSDWDMLTPRVDEISPNPFNKREMRKLDELADDIRENGLDSPVTVLDRDEFVKYWGARYPEACAALTTRFVLGPGERRWRASQLAGVETIRAILRNDKIPSIKGDLMRENYHRENPSVIEQARIIAELQVDEGLSYQQICDQLGIKSRGTITKLLNLLKLPPAVQDAIHAGEISQKAGTILGELPDEASVTEALALLVQGEAHSPRDAVNRARSVARTVSQGNTDDQQSASGEAEPENVDDDAGDAPASEATTPPAGAAAQAATERSSSPSSPAAANKPAASAAPARSAADTEAIQRATAARERESTCIRMLADGISPTGKQLDDLLRRAVLVGGRIPGRSRAHGWLLTAGKAQFNIKEPEGYFDAVLSSGDDDLIEFATWAAALGDNEVRASDRRRPAWDTHDARYVQMLIDCAGYQPSTAWERSTLERLGVSLGNTTETQQDDQESA